MTIYELLRAFLLADAAIAVRVGTRIYPVLQPQRRTYPLIVITMPSDPSADHLRGAGPRRPRFQIDVWSPAFDECQALAGLVERRLLAFTGTWTDTSVSPTVDRVVAVQRENGLWLFEGDVNEGYYRHTSDWFVQHQGKAS